MHTDVAACSVAWLFKNVNVRFAPRTNGMLCVIIQTRACNIFQARDWRITVGKRLQLCSVAVRPSTDLLVAKIDVKRRGRITLQRQLTS